MSYIITREKKNICKVKVSGEMIQKLSMFVSVGNVIAGQIMKEKNLNKEQAIHFLAGCLCSTYKTLKEGDKP